MNKPSENKPSDALSTLAQHELSRNRHNEEFLRRLFARRPQARTRYEPRLMQPEAAMMDFSAAAAAGDETEVPAPDARTFLLETIVNEERPVLFVKDDWLDTDNVTAIGVEAEELIRALGDERRVLEPRMPLIGRIDVTNFPNGDFVGTGWLVDSDIVVTNRHVAGLIARWDGRRFAFSRGIAGELIGSSFDTLHEFDDLTADQSRAFAVTEVLYIEPDRGPDIAFLRVARRTDGTRLDRIEVAAADLDENARVVVVGYPARAPKRVIPDQNLMQRLYRDRYDVKRAAPGLIMNPERGSIRHDCTTLGGNSGSCVLDIKTGQAVGLHFAGLYQEANFAVPAPVLSDYVRRKRWNEPVTVESSPLQTKPPAAQKPPAQPQAPAAAGPQSAAAQPAVTVGSAGASVTITIPLSIVVSLGQPVIGGAPEPDRGRENGGTAAPPAPASPAEVEAAVKAFWDERPEGVVAARVGFADRDGALSDEVFIAASAPADRLEAVAASWPAAFRGLAVHYFPANVTELLESELVTESVDSISYDNEARTGPEFSLAPVDEAMIVRAHVGPEYSWDELKTFLDGVRGRLVSAMYEFHGDHIKEVIEARLNDGASLTLVLDNATFSRIKDDSQEFDRATVFGQWGEAFGERFRRVVAPERETGLISDSYHAKVSVRDDATFWLSSGNWKKTSSQPVITEEERNNIGAADLPGNREWHVVVRSPSLATRFRNHILQDFNRSRDLGGGNLPRNREATDRLVDVAIEEAPVEEARRPPKRLLAPRVFERKLRVIPLLTPDRDGAVYSEAVLELIRSARKSLLFQIPYIGMPSNPHADRGYIDELIEALTQKLKTLDDARVLLRAGGSRFSAPAHAAWYFKSKGVDVDNRLRSLLNHHTKGMIVDGERVLIGSHNWSKPGVSLNRDTSLIFDDAEIAAYFADAFEIDWARANAVRPRRFERPEAAILEARGAEPPPGYRRIPLSELWKEDD
ncbi:phospholipase D-like domain-containing protein [Pseudochelatococcus sp. B33]